MLIHLSRNGQTYGPYSAEQFEALLASGQVEKSDEMWVQSDIWEPLSAFERYFGPHAESVPQRIVTPVAATSAPPAPQVRLTSQRPRKPVDEEEGHVNLLRTMMGV